MPSFNVSRYLALENTFQGSEDPAIQEALKAFFWDRFQKAEAGHRKAAEALSKQELGSPCSLVEPACTGQPEAKTGPSEYLRLTKFDGAMTFIDAKGVFRFRVSVDYQVEELDQTCPTEVAHLEPLIMAKGSTD
jgi:hypothetical protein